MRRAARSGVSAVWWPLPSITDDTTACRCGLGSAGAGALGLGRGLRGIAIEPLLPLAPHKFQCVGRARDGEQHGAPQPCEHEYVQDQARSEEHTSELQSQSNLVCRLLLEKKKQKKKENHQR